MRVPSLSNLSPILAHVTSIVTGTAAANEGSDSPRRFGAPLLRGNMDGDRRLQLQRSARPANRAQEWAHMSPIKKKQAFVAEITKKSTGQ